jgi:hypothetical protein
VCTTPCQAYHPERRPGSSRLHGFATTEDDRSRIRRLWRVCGPPRRLCPHPPTSQRPTNVSDVGPVVGEDVGIAPQQPDEKPVADAEEINWFTDDCVVLYEQPSTAIYFNRVGALVIRQEGRDGPDDDPFIIIAKNNIEEFLDRLTDICGVPSYPPKG